MGRKKGRGKGSRRHGSGGAGSSTGRLVAKRSFTPDERRAAVEAYYGSELSRHAFARQWGLSHVTLGVWVRKYEAEGPKGLERLASGPPRRRGKAPLAEAVKAEIVAVREAHPEFGWKRLRTWLWRFAGPRPPPSVPARKLEQDGSGRAAECAPIHMASWRTTPWMSIRTGFRRSRRLVNWR